MAAPDGATGGLVVWATNQAPHGFRNDLAGVLSMDQNMIRVVVPEMGGGFGVKFGVYPEDAVVAALARVYRIPLRWVETRMEHMLATTHGRDQVTDMEAAVEADGHIIGLRVKVVANIGAYPIFTFIPDLTLFMAVGVYRIENIDLQSTCVDDQHDFGGRLSRGRASGSRLLHRAAGRHGRGRARQDTRRNSAS